MTDFQGTSPMSSAENKCPVCGDSGRVPTGTHGDFQHYGDCPTCKGTGRAEGEEDVEVITEEEILAEIKASRRNKLAPTPNYPEFPDSSTPATPTGEGKASDKEIIEYLLKNGYPSVADLFEPKNAPKDVSRSLSDSTEVDTSIIPSTGEPTFQERVREILKDHSGMDFCGDTACLSYQLYLQALAAITQAVLEVVGEDDFYKKLDPCPFCTGSRQYGCSCGDVRNDLRATIRERITKGTDDGKTR